VGRSIFPADEIGRAQRQRPETTRPQLAAHRKAKEKPAGLSRRVWVQIAVWVWCPQSGKGYSWVVKKPFIAATAMPGIGPAIRCRSRFLTCHLTVDN